MLDVAGERGGLYAWIAPTYYIAERGIKALKLIGGEALEFKGQNPVRCNFVGAGGPVEILFLSADSPDTILGDGFDGVVVDEAARIPKEVWDLNIRPALADKLGWAILISTPRARNWFFDFHRRGLDPNEKLYRSYTFSSRDNPYFHQEEWEEAERTTPQDIFRQEYQAEFLMDSAGVFRGVKDCIMPVSGTQSGDVVIGCDLAKHKDWTVLIAMDRKTGHALEMERFNKLSWPIQKEKITSFAGRWRGLVIMDATGVGDPIYDDLNLTVPRIEPVKLTNASKTHLIQRLAVAIEQRQIGWPSGQPWDLMVDELERYEFDMTDKGLITYNAPSGYHDDTVIALALANSGRFEMGYQPMPKAFPRTVHSPIRRVRSLGRCLY